MEAPLVKYKLHNISWRENMDMNRLGNTRKLRKEIPMFTTSDILLFHFAMFVDSKESSPNIIRIDSTHGSKYRIDTALLLTESLLVKE